MTATVRNRLRAGVENASEPLAHFLFIYCVIIVGWTVSVSLAHVVMQGGLAPGPVQVLAVSFVYSFLPAVVLAGIYEQVIER